MNAIVINYVHFETDDPERLLMCYELNLILFAITRSDNLKELVANLKFIFENNRIEYFEYRFEGSVMRVSQKMEGFKNQILYVNLK